MITLNHAVRTSTRLRHAQALLAKLNAITYTMENRAKRQALIDEICGSWRMPTCFLYTPEEPTHYTLTATFIDYLLEDPEDP